MSVVSGRIFEKREDITAAFTSVESKKKKKSERRTDNRVKKRANE